MLRVKSILSLLGIMILMGCSKDEIPVNSTSETEVKTGIFVDSAVEGLFYRTPTRSGFTNVKGEFEYLAGETVSFYVGKLKLGSAEGVPVMTPITISSEKDATIYTKEVQNMAALLQTLDIDGNPDNGIKLVPEVVKAIDPHNFNLKQPERNMILEIVKMVKEKTGIQLNEKFPDEAAAHLAETLGENYNIYTSLIPFIESWVNHTIPKTSTEWNHEYDDNGKLIRSVQFEKYPNRIIAAYDYADYDEQGYPNKAIKTVYWLGNPTGAVTRGISYDEEHNVTGIANYSKEGELHSTFDFIQKDTDGFITEAKSYNAAGEFDFRDVYVLDENKNNVRKIRYSSESGTDSSDILLHLELAYTDFGDLATITDIRQQGSDRITTFIYRDDNTLSQTKLSFSNNNTVYDYFYDAQEVKLNEFHITQGEWRSEYVEFYPDGSYKLINTYFNEWLQEIATFDENGYAQLQIWHLDKSGSFQIDYRNPDWSLYQIDYYDDEGNFYKTEYYEGNVVVNTEYM